MRSVMHDPSLGRQQILRPYLLNMDQSTLPLAEEEMLQRRDLNKIIFGVQLQSFLHGDAQWHLLVYLDLVVSILPRRF